MKNNEVKEIELIRKNGMPTLKITRNKGAETMPLTDGFQIHKANEFLKSLNPDYYVVFRTWNQYMDLINRINDELKIA